MKKAILKRLGSFVLVCFMVVLNLVGFVVPASAEESEELPTAQIYEQYTDLQTKGEDLFADLWAYLQSIEWFSLEDVFWWEDAPVPLHVQNVQINDHVFLLDTYWDNYYSAYVFKVKLISHKYYVLRNPESLEDAVLINSSDEELGSVAGFHDTFVFSTDDNYLYLRVSEHGPFVRLYEVESFKTNYDVSRTGFAEDMAYIFTDTVNPTLENYPRVRDSVQTINVLAIWDDVDTLETSVRSPYVYLYDSSGKADSINDLKFVDKSGNTIQLTKIISQNGKNEISALDKRLGGRLGESNRWFCKYRANGWQATISGNSETFTLDQIRVTYSGDTEPKIYWGVDQTLTVGKDANDNTNFRVQGNNSVIVDVNHTFYRTDTSATGGAYHHNQIDSVYFRIPDYYLLRYGDVSNVRVSFQRVRTKPILVLKSGSGMYRTFYDFAKAGEPLPEYSSNPFNPHRDGDFPVFWSEDGTRANSLGSNTFAPEYAFNTTWHGQGVNDPDLIYWVFGVENPKVTSTSVNFNSASTVNYAALNDWAYSYPIENGSVNMVAWLAQMGIVADSEGRIDTSDSLAKMIAYVQEHPEELAAIRGFTLTGGDGEINAELFSEIAFPSILNTKDLNLNADGYAVGHSFWQRVFEYGFGYAWDTRSQKAKDNEALTLDPVVVITNQSQLSSEVSKYYVGDEADFQACFNRACSNSETMFLVRFAVSDYYATPVTVSFNGKETSGYLAEEDMYLDFRVLELEFTDDTGVVTTISVKNKPFDVMSPITTELTPEQVNEEAWKHVIEKAKNNIWDFLKKALVIIAIVVIVLVVLRLVMWIVGRKKSNTTVVIRDDVPRRNRRWRR